MATDDRRDGSSEMRSSRFADQCAGFIQINLLADRIVCILQLVATFSLMSGNPRSTESSLVSTSSGLSVHSDSEFQKNGKDLQ